MINNTKYNKTRIQEKLNKNLTKVLCQLRLMRCYKHTYGSMRERMKQ